MSGPRGRSVTLLSPVTEDPVVDEREAANAEICQTVEGCIADGEYNRAVAYCDEILKKDRYARAFLLKGLAYCYQGEYEDALICHEQGLRAINSAEENDLKIKGLHYKATVLLLLGKNDLVYKVLGEALLIKPGDLGIFALWSIAALSGENSALSAVYLVHANSLLTPFRESDNTNDFSTRMAQTALGLMCYKQKRVGECDVLLARSLKNSRGPEKEMLYLLQGIMFTACKDYFRAHRNCFNQAVGLKLMSMSVLRQKGRSYAQQGRTDQAIIFFQKASELSRDKKPLQEIIETLRNQRTEKLGFPGGSTRAIIHREVEQKAGAAESQNVATKPMQWTLSPPSPPVTPKKAADDAGCCAFLRRKS